jgi:hypothetical protein
MKITKVLVPCLILLAAVGSKAQTKTGSSITDEDLKKYAITMDSIESMQETLRQIVAETVQKNKVTTVARYNQLFKITDDAAKLKEAQATPEEIEFLKQVEDLRTMNIARINATYQDLAKEYVGIKAFNAIRKSLESDQALKTRYETVSKDIETKQKGG